MRNNGMWNAAFAVAAIVLLAAGARAEGIIQTVAGGGPNNMPALEANLGTPGWIAVDTAGNLFVAARDQNRIFRVDASGLLTVVAGNGDGGFSGDGGPATEATLSRPHGVAVDATGNLIIADWGNNRIRRVSPSGTITTIAGNGTFGFSGDGGPASQASLNQPRNVAADSEGNLYIADTNNNRIRKVDTSGTITTIAGNGDAAFYGDGGPATDAALFHPLGVCTDDHGNLFFADAINSRIRKVDAAGIITTVAGNGGRRFSGDGGPATDAQLGIPNGVGTDDAGNLYIADTNNHRIRKVDTSGIITTIAGTGSRGRSGDGGPAINARLDIPLSVVVDDGGNVLIAEALAIRAVNTSGIISKLAGNDSCCFAGDGGVATDASLRFPRGLSADGAGNLLIADEGNSRIREVDASGIITTVAGNGKFGFSGDLGPAIDAQLRSPRGVAADSAGNFFIADSRNHRIRKVDPTGIITTVAGNGSPGFSGDGGPATAASLNEPMNVATSPAGDLFIADSRNNRIRRVDSSGIITTFAGNGISGFAGDGGSAVDASLWLTTSFTSGDVATDSSGNLFIADTFNNRIRKVDRTGLITTVAGNGDFHFSGDGGPAEDASLRWPFSVSTDAAGSLYIADTQNLRIRKVDPLGIITTVAGSGEFGFSGDGGPATEAAMRLTTGVETDPEGNLFIVFQSHGADRVRAVYFSPESQLGNLSALVESLELQPGIDSSLTAKLDAALGILEDSNSNNDIAAVGLLESFIQQVETARGIRIEQADADRLIRLAEIIIDNLLEG